MHDFLKQYRSFLICLVVFTGVAGPNRVGMNSAETVQSNDSELVELDRRMLIKMIGRRETLRAVFHFEPGAIRAAELDAAIDAMGAEIEELERTMEMAYRGRVHFFLYRDVAELIERTEVAEGTAAFSTGTVSVHQPHDFRNCHELVHIFALQIPKITDGTGPDLFVVEGLATALAKTDENVSIPEWCECYEKLGAVPNSLVEFRRGFPVGAATGVHPYHIAGGFVDWLISQYGISKVKQWYVDSAEAHRWFGKGLGQLEREWRESLRNQSTSSEARKHVFGKLGVNDEPIPEAWAKKKSAPLFRMQESGGLPAELAAESPELWKFESGRLVGKNSGPWTHLETKEKYPIGTGIRARVRLVEGDAIKFRVNGDREVILAKWSSFLTAASGFVGNDRQKIPVGDWCEVVVVNDNGRARAWLNGVSLFDVPSAWPVVEAGTLGIAVERGVIEIETWEVFEIAD